MSPITFSSLCAFALLCATSNGCSVLVGVSLKPGVPLPRPVIKTCWPLDREVATSLPIGQATYDDVIKKCGSPVGEAPYVASDKTAKVAVYQVKGPLFEKGIHPGEQWPQRGQVFMFKNDVLVGEAYYSSWESDHTDFDDSKVDQIVEGRTNREQVLAILGPASGRELSPGDDLRTPTGLDYLFRSRRRYYGFMGRDHTKWLRIQFDHQGIVTDCRLVSGFKFADEVVGEGKSAQAEVAALPTIPTETP